MVTFSVYATFPETGKGWTCQKHLSEEFSIAFRPIYCPLIFSISTTPIFGFHHTPRYNGLMKKWQLKILSHLEIYTQKQKDSFFPLHFCLQSAQCCWTEAFAAKGVKSSCVIQVHPLTVLHRHRPETWTVKRYSHQSTSTQPHSGRWYTSIQHWRQVSPNPTYKYLRTNSQCNSDGNSPIDPKLPCTEVPQFSLPI